MRKIKLEHSFLVFLYAYLRHIDLSLDRSRWNAWADYVGYAHDRIDPAIISMYLKGKIGSVSATNKDYILPERSYIKSSLLYLWRISTRQNDYLTVAEAGYVCQLLDRHGTYLRADITEYTPEPGMLRIDSAAFYTRASWAMLSRSELHKIMHVEPFWQSPALTTIALEEFIPSYLARV